MTDEETTEIKQFTVMVFTIDMIIECAGCPGEADELIKLAASYGCPKNITTD